MTSVHVIMTHVNKMLYNMLATCCQQVVQHVAHMLYNNVRVVEFVPYMTALTRPVEFNSTTFVSVTGYR